MRNDALALAKQIRQHAGVFDGNLMSKVREHKAYPQITRLAIDAALHHHAADAKALGERRLAFDDLRGIEIKHDVLARCHDGEGHRGGDPAEDAEHHEQAFTPRRHGASLAAMARARAARILAAARRRRAAPTFQTSTMPANPRQGTTQR